MRLGLRSAGRDAGGSVKRVGRFGSVLLRLGPFMVAFLNPGGWGSDFAWFIDNYTRMAGMWLVVVGGIIGMWGLLGWSLEPVNEPVPGAEH